MLACLDDLVQHFRCEFLQTWIFAFALHTYKLAEWDIKGSIADGFVRVAMLDVLSRHVSLLLMGSYRMKCMIDDKAFRLIEGRAW